MIPLVLSAVGWKTFGLRIHHSYVGLVMWVLALIFDHYQPDFWNIPTSGTRQWIYAFTLGLIVSDLIHHFLILWPIVGSPQFDLFYGQC